MKRIYKLNNLELTPFLINRYGYKAATEIEVYYHYYISKIINTYLFYGGGNHNGYVPISSDKLDAILGTKTLINRFETNDRPRLLRVIREDLIELGVILYHHNLYTSNGVKCKVMTKITKEYLDNGWTQIPDSQIPFKLKFKQTEKQLENLENKKRKKYGVSYEEKKEFHHKIEECFKKLTFDHTGASNYLNSALQNRVTLKSKKNNLNRKMNILAHDSWKMAIDNFDSRYLTVDFKCGRIFTNAVNLPSELRQFIRTQNGHLMNQSWDVSNCQPLLLCLCIECEVISSLYPPKDYVRYKWLCESGIFYKTFIELMEKDGHTVNKELFKQEFFEHVLFGKYSEKKINKFRKTFAKHFPTISKYLEQIKKLERKNKNNNILAIKLQKFEAKIMIEGVATKLIKNGVIDFYTVHDGFYTTIASSKVVKQTIIDEFKKYGLEPDVK